MLWRKHAREIRGLAVLAGLSLVALGCHMLSDVGGVRRQYVPARPDIGLAASYEVTPVSFVAASYDFLEGMLPTVLIATAIFLGMGGLGYERAAGTSVFALSLPFSRRRLLLGRFFAGAAVILALAICSVTGTSLWAAIRGVGGDFTLTQALGLGCCVASAAIAIYAFAFLSANVTASAVRSIATVASLLVILALTVNPRNRAPDRWTIAWFVEPLDFIKLVSRNGLLRGGAVPWGGIALAVGIAACLLAVTVRWVEHHDF